MDEAQSVGVSAAPFHPQKIISISKEPEETGGYKVPFVASKHAFKRNCSILKSIVKSKLFEIAVRHANCYTWHVKVPFVS